MPDPRVFHAPLASCLAAQAAANEATSTQSDAPDSAWSEWLDDQGRVWKPVLLSHALDDKQVITGVAALLAPARGDFNPPVQMAAAISEFYADRGVSMMMLGSD